MLAIPILQSRVAPVFNWCSKVLILPEDATESATGEEVDLACASDPFTRLKILREKEVTLLICGALSPELLEYAQHLNISVTCGVAGEIEQVLHAHRFHQLDKPQFRLPGCFRGRCYRNGAHESEERSENMPGKSGKQDQSSGRFGQGGQGRGKRMSAAGPGGECECPKCGATAPHQRGIPCTQVQCPQCRGPMMRKQ